MFVFGEKEIICFASKKKIEYLRSIESKSFIPITFYIRDKLNEDEYFEKILNIMKSGGNDKVIAGFEKDNFEGSFYENWKRKVKLQNFTHVIKKYYFIYKD